MTISVRTPEVFNGSNFKAARFDKDHSRSDKNLYGSDLANNVIAPKIKSRH